MNLAYVHLLLNHLPILGTLIALGLFLVSLVANQDDLKQVSLVLFSLIALVAIPTYMSGSGAEELIKDSPDVSMAVIETHQGAALVAFIFMEITGAVSVLGLWRFSRTVKNPWLSGPARLNLLAVLLLASVTAGLMAIAGNTGGEIRHPEILSQQESTSVVGNAGSKLILSIHHFVIDSSMWVWPILEDLHFIGLILLLGAIGVVNLRVLGFLKQLPVGPLHRFIPWGIAGFGINVITGFLFYLGMPGFYNMNFVFQLKMFTILLAGATLLLFYCTSTFRKLGELGPGEDAPPFAKFIAVTSIVLWLAVIVLGRYIPFGEVT
ncbi:MAG: hypothetical protein DMG14_00820 [Acidobacteria bacterium]|nr:MAG: hypothetical protein DMG14_00820 [Acidobacteriota bacterium]